MRVVQQIEVFKCNLDDKPESYINEMNKFLKEIEWEDIIDTKFITNTVNEYQTVLTCAVTYKKRIYAKGENIPEPGMMR